MPIRGSKRPSVTGLESDPTWLGSDYGDGHYVGTGLDFMSSSNPMYDAYYKANPYVNQTYHKTWIDQIFGGVFRTGYDKWLDEMKLNSAQYNAGIVDLEQQNLFNSEVAKAQRMRDAGENPDLLGTGDVSEASSTNPDPQDAQIPEAEGAQVLNIVSQVGMSMVDLIPKTLSFMSNLSQLRGIRMDNDLKELEFGNNAVDFATKFFTEGITKQDYEDAFTTGNFENLLDASKKDADYLTNTFLSSPRARKAFKLAYGTHARSLVAEMSKYKTYAEYEDARKKNLTQRASQFFSDDDDTQMSLIKSILGPYEKYQQRMNEINLRIAQLRDPDLEQGTINAGLRAEKAYNDNIDGALQAQTENAGNEYQKQLYEILKATDDMFAEIMQNLNESDKWYSPIAKALVGIARSQLLSGIHMQIGRHSSTYTNPQTGAESSSEGFNLGF